MRCIVVFDNPSEHYPIAERYFEMKYERQDGRDVLAREPWLAEQFHFVGEALIYDLYFRERMIRLHDANSVIEFNAKLPDRVPDASRNDVKVWIEKYA